MKTRKLIPRNLFKYYYIPNRDHIWRYKNDSLEYCYFFDKVTRWRKDNREAKVRLEKILTSGGVIIQFEDIENLKKRYQVSLLFNTQI